MSLDLSILSDSDVQLKHVPIELAFFGQLVAEAELMDAELVLRMSEYYDDALYESSELPALLEELNALAKVRALDANYLKKIALMRALVQEAQVAGLRVMAIAD